VLIGTITGILFNFHTTGKLVFKKFSNGLLPRFFLVYGLTYGLNVGFLWIFDQFKFNMYIAGALLLAPMAVISFILNKKFVFKCTEKSFSFDLDLLKR